MAGKAVAIAIAASSMLAQAAPAAQQKFYNLQVISDSLPEIDGLNIASNRRAEGHLAKRSSPLVANPSDSNAIDYVDLKFNFDTANGELVVRNYPAFKQQPLLLSERSSPDFTEVLGFKREGHENGLGVIICDVSGDTEELDCSAGLPAKRYGKADFTDFYACSNTLAGVADSVNNYLITMAQPGKQPPSNGGNNKCYPIGLALVETTSP